MAEPRAVEEISGLGQGPLPIAELIEAQLPVIFKGAAAHWPLVREGLVSPRLAIDYLKRFYQGRQVTAYRGDPAIQGRFFYNPEMTGLNFQAGRIALDAFLDEVDAHLDDDQAPSFYVGSTDVDVFLPGLRAENDVDLDPSLFGAPPLIGIWIGNRTIASTHYDMSNNLACNLVGRRRFTLFPPDQVANLYPGPLEPTPGGQVVSMVDPDAPDLDAYPRFAEAWSAALIADLEPGDLLFYPALWWHHVRAKEGLNVMVNYWWNASPAFMDTPMTTLLHGLLSLRDRPESEKRAWRALFDYYVFGPAGRAAEHLPEHARGDLAPMDEMRARRMRARLLDKLNR